MSDQDQLRKLKYAGLEYGLTIVGLSGLGYWLDLTFETQYWLTILLSLIGMIGGTYKLCLLNSESGHQSGTQRPEEEKANSDQKLEK